MLPGLAKEICSPEKHPDPPLDARRLSDWVNAEPFTKSHGARSARRTEGAPVAAAGEPYPRRAANVCGWDR